MSVLSCEPPAALDGRGRPVSLGAVLELASISETLVNEMSRVISDAGLVGIVILMTLDTACIPIPSEVVLLFAGFAVVDPVLAGTHHDMTFAGVVAASLVGTMLGSWIAYAVGRAGRLELFERHGERFHVGPTQVAAADRWFQRYGQPAVLFGRMVPVVRAFISLPAGAARMPLLRFSVLSFVGAIPWVVGLVLAGEALGRNWEDARKAFEYVDYVILALIVLAIVYAVVRRRRRGRRRPATDAAG
jgi:membrane protein DedA with SNARE-associated domain